MTATFDVPEPPVRALAWRGGAEDGHLAILDQTLLPEREVWNERARAVDVVDDIRRLAVRGAPAIGVAAAFGLVLAAREAHAEAADDTTFARAFEARLERLARARPTAVNLAAAVERCRARATPTHGDRAGAASRLLDAARDLERYESDACAAIGRHGAALLDGCVRVLTHCNAGALVTPGLGTALAPLYVLHAAGRPLEVWVDETRPLLQGMRLTAWELGRAGIPHRVLCDGAAASLMARGRVDAVIVGADRVCANGDVTNKIGTYAAALAARHHGVPFYVAAPLTTLDPRTARGDDVRIEERAGDEARYLASGLLPEGSGVYAPAFDVTPAALVSALITERGTLAHPDPARLQPWMEESHRLQAGDSGCR